MSGARRAELELWLDMPSSDEAGSVETRRRFSCCPVGERDGEDEFNRSSGTSVDRGEGGLERLGDELTALGGLFGGIKRGVGRFLDIQSGKGRSQGRELLLEMRQSTPGYHSVDPTDDGVYATKPT